jgi:peptidoglycan/LPS O-acetylase OafA/YrhL
MHSASIGKFTNPGSLAGSFEGRRNEILSIQYLRALAAILVVFHHARYQIEEYEIFFGDGA